MRKDKLNIIAGGLLHDIGKIAKHHNKFVNHSDAGYDFLKNEVNFTNKSVLEHVKFHNENAVSDNMPESNSTAYITYIADNIASGMDRCENDTNINSYNSDKALKTVFDILNNNNQNYQYSLCTMGETSGINYPSNTEISFSQEIYYKICDDIKECIKDVGENDTTYINSLLKIMEADCSFIPSSANHGELTDISLYDHSKITAAIGSCILDFLEEQNISDYKSVLYKNTKEFYSKNAFLMYSFDVSGIQDFIYTIMSKGTLKLLRARSFYIELLCEHLIDTILEKLELSRTNLIYSGGGHGYILLPNTDSSKRVTDEIHMQTNRWFIDNFKTGLYIAAAYTECSANDLMNTKDGNYENIFMRLSEKLSAEKSNRYSAEDIKLMNYNPHQHDERECVICRRADTEIKNDICGICQKLMDMSDNIIEKDLFIIMDNNSGLPLPFGQSVISLSEQETKDIMTHREYVRSYSKNKKHTGLNVTTSLWVGDYHTEKEFEKLAQKSNGIKRIGVMRADVDNLGKAFVSGFEKKNASLLRTAILSKKLSVFFKKHINTILKENKCEGLIVYSGGDDIFLVSSWSDAIKSAVKLHDAFEKFTQNTLTISAGIGIYDPKYPISAMAYESGELESKSKELGRNCVTLFSSDNSDKIRYTYTWEDLKSIDEKKKYIKEHFTKDNEHGKNLLYNLLEYLRNTDEKINIARYAYTLTLAEPDNDADGNIKEQFRKFARQMYNWMCSKEDRYQLITAIYLYVYETRNFNKQEE